MTNFVDRLLDKCVNEDAGKPFKRPNPYEKPKDISFYKWMEEINKSGANSPINK